MKFLSVLKKQRADKSQDFDKSFTISTKKYLVTPPQQQQLFSHIRTYPDRKTNKQQTNDLPNERES